MSEIKKNYKRMINYNASHIKYALLHITHQKDGRQSVYYEEDYLNKAGLHTVYYGYNTREPCPEMICRDAKGSLILGAVDGIYKLAWRQDQKLAGNKKTIIDRVNDQMIDSYESLTYADDTYRVIMKSGEQFVITEYHVEKGYITQMIMYESEDGDEQQIRSKTTFDVLNINQRPFSQYQHIRKVLHDHQNTAVKEKDHLLDDLGDYSRMIFNNILHLVKR